MDRYWWMRGVLCAALAACSSEAAPAANSPPDAPDSGEVSDDAPDASRPEADAGDLPPIAQPPVESPYVEPKAAAPCGTALDFVGGHARPDFGAVAMPDEPSLDPEKPGAYAVFEKPLSIPIMAETRTALGYTIEIAAGELAATVYAPSGDAGESAAKGPFPLIVGAPGFQAGYADYAGFFRHFASHGFFVVGVQTRGSNTTAEHDKEALETVQAISYMLEQSEYRAQLDASKVATTGHSKGGKVSFFAAALDPRIDLVFGWDPSNAGGPPCGLGLPCNAFPVAPNCLAEQEGDALASGVLHLMRAETLVFGVPPDPLFNPTAEHNALQFYRGAPSPASLVYFSGGHAAWVDTGYGGLLANAEIIRATKTVQTAKLLSAFYGATDLADYLPRGAYLAGLGELVQQVETK